MRPLVVLAAAILLATAAPTPASAQSLTAAGLSAGRAAPALPALPGLAIEPRAVRQPANDLALALAGVAGAAVGTVAGAYLGYQLDYETFHWDCENGCEDPGLLGLLGGWFVGSALTTPLSVRLASGRRGSLSTSYLSSAIIAGAGLAGLLTVGSPEGAVFLLAAPVAQAVSAVVIERR